MVRLYALRNWIEQSYKQVENALGWALYQVSKDISIRRHWQMVCLAFTSSWWESSDLLEAETPAGVTLQSNEPDPALETQTPEGGKKERRSSEACEPLVASGAAKSEDMAGTISHAHTLLEGVLESAPTRGAKIAA